MALTAAERQRAYRERNKELALARAREWKKHNAEKVKESTKRWREQNRERYLEAQRVRLKRWREANPERNRDLRRKYKQTRRARIWTTSVEEINPREIYERDGYRCHLCGKRVPEKELSVDHLIPLSKGGPHTRANLACAHRSCNCRRGAGHLPAQLRLEA